MIEKEDLYKLDYIGMVFKEALRLWPPVPSINRITVEDIHINGYFIPKNTEISVSLFLSTNLYYDSNSSFFLILLQVFNLRYS